MTPSERIRVIKEITQRLAPEEWPLIDLTLKQFSLPWTPEWGGDKSGYIIEMISKASDDILIQLASHVGFQFEQPRSLIEPSFWQSGHFRLFMSHLSKDRSFTSSLQMYLSLLNVSSFVAHKDIEPTKEWEEEILLALSTCDALLAVLTTGFHESNWTDQEVGFVMGRGKLVFTISLGQTPYGFLGRFQALNGNGKSEKDLAKEIVQILSANKQTAKRMSYALVSLFEESSTFQSAKDYMSLLEGVTYWDPSITARVRSAVQTNDQISKAFKVPERVEALIKKWT